MEYAAVFLLTIALIALAMRGLARGELPQGAIAASALALSMCASFNGMSLSFAVAAAIGARSVAEARSALCVLCSATCACIFALAGQAAFPYSMTIALVLATVLATAFATSPSAIVGSVTTGSVFADMYSFLFRPSGFLRLTAFDFRTAAALVIVAAWTCVWRGIRGARGPALSQVSSLSAALGEAPLLHLVKARGAVASV